MLRLGRSWIGCPPAKSIARNRNGIVKFGKGLDGRNKSILKTRDRASHELITNDVLMARPADWCKLSEVRGGVTCRYTRCTNRSISPGSIKPSTSVHASRRGDNHAVAAIDVESPTAGEVFPVRAEVRTPGIHYRSESIINRTSDPLNPIPFINPLFPATLALLLALSSEGVAAPAPGPALSAQDERELITTYAHLTTDYYKKVDQQAVLDDERGALLTYLRKAGISNPRLPVLRATDNERTNAIALEYEVSDAVARYAQRAGGKAGVKVGTTQIAYAAMAGVLGSVKDKYTLFLSPKEFSEINETLDGTHFGGVGLTYDIDKKTKDVAVQDVIPDGPADKAGLLSEDMITRIDGRSIAELVAGKAPDLQSKIIQGLLRGEPGTTVTLAVDRGGSAQSFTITRATIHSPSVLSRLLPGGIGWIRLSVFGADTGHELDQALQRLDAQGAKAYILDLRFNGGGYVTAAIDVSSKFIASGPIVTVQSRAGVQHEYDAENVAIAPRPLAVLVNHYSASASEITAGALQDSGVAEIIGTRTYGKGVVQSVFPLGDGSAAKITTARYLTPHGRDINSVGIEPQIVSELPKNTRVRLGDPATDIQLAAAISYLQSHIAQDATKQ